MLRSSRTSRTSSTSVPWSDVFLKGPTILAIGHPVREHLKVAMRQCQVDWIGLDWLTVETIRRPPVSVVTGTSYGYATHGLELPTWSFSTEHSHQHIERCHKKYFSKSEDMLLSEI